MIAEASSARQRPDGSVELELFIRRAYDDKHARIKLALSSGGAEALIFNLTHPAGVSDRDKTVSDANEDVVDQEFDEAEPTFTDEKVGLPQPILTDPPRSITTRRRLWPKVLFLLAGIGLLYLVLGTGRKPDTPQDWPPGWYDLSDCVYTTSLDETKELHLSGDSRAVLYDRSGKENGPFRRVDGLWNFNEATQRYAVTLDGATEMYSMLRPGGLCALIKGDEGSADLRASWFAKGYDYEGPTD